jgi:hypothetical protein
MPSGCGRWTFECLFFCCCCSCDQVNIPSCKAKQYRLNAKWAAGDRCKPPLIIHRSAAGWSIIWIRISCNYSLICCMLKNYLNPKFPAVWSDRAHHSGAYGCTIVGILHGVLVQNQRLKWSEFWKGLEIFSRMCSKYNHAVNLILKR